MSGPFKMKGHSLPGPNQRVSPAKQKIDYKAQGDVIDKRNKAIKDFDKDSADMGGYTPNPNQQSQIKERKKNLADELTFSTDSIANVNRQDRVKKTDKAFDELMGNTKGGEKAGKGARRAAPKYASPAKGKASKTHKHPHSSSNITGTEGKSTKVTTAGEDETQKNTKYFIGTTATDSTTYNQDLANRITIGKANKKTSK